MNFGLRVLGRRADGYHELESVFLPLDLSDELEIEFDGAGDVELRIDGAAAGLPAEAENLATRAARGFLSAAGLERRVRLRLRKRIPTAAGLGGGSSDAGAVLRGLARLLPGALDAAGLESVALALGADVPFFLDPRPALVTGIGERREPLAAGWPSWPLLLANPGEPLATARVFGAFDALTARGPAPTLPPLLEAVRKAPADSDVLGALLANDLEPAAARLCPALVRLRRALERAGARAVGLSGSGATVFGIFGSAEEAEAAGRELPPDVWVRVARTLESR